MRKPDVRTGAALLAITAVAGLGAKASIESGPELKPATPAESASDPDVVGPTYNKWDPAYSKRLMRIMTSNADHPRQPNPDAQGVRPHDGRDVPELWGSHDGPLPELDPPTEDDIAASDPG